MPLWNPWHGCTKCSPGCRNCYVYRRDAEFGKDASIVKKTASFNLPVKKDRHGNYKLKPEDGTVMTCFTSDFFHPDADTWRLEAWQMMRERSDLLFYFITKRPERFYEGLPADWGDGYENVHICCTYENQYQTDRRLPVFLNLPIRHREIIHEPMLQEIHIEKYLEQYHDQIECVSCGGESGEEPDSVTMDGSSSPECSVTNTACPFTFIRPAASLRKEAGSIILTGRIRKNRLENPGLTRHALRFDDWSHSTGQLRSASTLQPFRVSG